MQEILGKYAHLSTPIVSMKKTSIAGDNCYELFTTDSKSVGIFDEVIFACHTPTTKNILQTTETDEKLLKLVSKIEYADNVVYVHSDPKLMPARRRAWSSWNCLGKSKLLSSYKIKNSKVKESFEGGESGFGNKAHQVNVEESKSEAPLEGKDGRMKSVYVTYWLNRLQNLKTEKNFFVSLNPHERPAPEMTHKRLILAHPQFTPATLQARKELAETYQGKDGLWFCGAWGGYGFHEGTFTTVIDSQCDCLQTNNFDTS
jgi:cyclopropane-fatty-acyl-phospholipid synthase